MTRTQFDEITKWQAETFGHATADSKIAHLKQEVDELADDVANKSVNAASEFADCFILLFGAAASYGMTYTDICEAVCNKMKINRARTWGKPDANGVVNHIKPESK